MDFWTGLLIGLAAGWLVEWVIDRLFLRREYQKLLGLYNHLQTEAQQMRASLAGESERQARLAELDEANGRLQSQLEAEAGLRAAAESRASQLQSRVSGLEFELGQMRERLVEARQQPRAPDAGGPAEAG